jgi:hypothetical protein
MIPSKYFDEAELVWYANHMLERSDTTVRVSALEHETTFDLRFLAETSQGKKTSAIIEYQWDRSEGVLQIARLWKMQNPALPYDYARSGKREKNLMRLKGWAFNAPVMTPARERIIAVVEGREFRHDHEGKIRASVLAQVAANSDYDDVATIAVKDGAKPKHSVILFDAPLAPIPGM